MGAAAALIGVVTEISGKVQDGVAIEKQGEAQAKAFEHNADLKEENANQIMQAFHDEGRRLSIIQRRDYGTQRAQYGASGLTADGSPLDVLQDSIAKGDMDMLTLAKNAGRKAGALRNDARYDRLTADQARRFTRFNSLSLLLPGGSALAKAYPTISAYQGRGSEVGSSGSDSGGEELNADD